jgi:hypothetical protein
VSNHDPYSDFLKILQMASPVLCSGFDRPPTHFAACRKQQFLHCFKGCSHMCIAEWIVSGRIADDCGKSICRMPNPERGRDRPERVHSKRLGQLSCQRFVKMMSLDRQTTGGSRYTSSARIPNEHRPPLRPIRDSAWVAPRVLVPGAKVERLRAQGLSWSKKSPRVGVPKATLLRALT